MLLAFLGFVVLLSGFVAYAADTIARRVGRRHLRLFGLRPKTTALIVAVASGMGISLASVLAFAVLNRQAIFNIAQADQVRQELRDLRTSVQATEAELGQVSRQRDAAVAQARTLQAQRQQAIRDRDEANAEVQISAALLQQSRDSRSELYSQAQALSDRVQELADRRDQLTALAEASQRDLSRTQAQTRSLSAQVQAARQQVQTYQAQVARSQAQVRALTASRAALESRVREAEAQAEQATARASAAAQRARSAQAQIARVQGRLTALAGSVDTLQATRAQLQAERDRLNRDLLSLKAVRDSLQRDNTTLQQGLETAVAERDRLQADVRTVTSELSATRSGGLIYRRGDPVSTSVVATVANLPEALHQADLSARARGAVGAPAAVLPPDLLQQLQAKLRGLNTTALVSCRAASNTAPGYPVELSCDAVANTLLYRQGDVIRSAQVDLSASPDQLRVQVLDLESAVLRDLSTRGVPPERVNDGGLSASELLDLLSQLRGRQPGARSATVSIAAGADVRPGSRVDLYATVR